jgi:hypothetical protein
MRRFFSLLVTHTASSPKASPKEPGATAISATALPVAGSIRASVPFASVISHTLPAPTAMPPSLSPTVMGVADATLPVLRSTRPSVESPHMGTQRLPKPAARPEQGALPTLIAPTALFARGSIRITVSSGSLEIHTSSSMAIQSGAPGTSKTWSGLRRSIGMRTDGSLTPGRLRGA